MVNYICELGLPSTRIGWYGWGRWDRWLAGWSGWDRWLRSLAC